MLEHAAASGMSLATRMFPLFRKQVHLRTCGLASLSISLDYLLGHKSVSITEGDIEAVINQSSCSRVSEIHSRGMTLAELSEVTMEVKKSTMAAPIASEVVRLTDEDSLRSLLTQHLACPRASATSAVICNYSMAVAGQGHWWGGHFSPAAAMDPETDRVLILDVWMFTHPFWIEIKRLYNAMDTVDKTCGERRGVLVLHATRET